MKYPKVSIIVPVYNTEKYIARCIDSILNQTYPNLEIVIINDGSTDDSQSICQNYVDINENVKLFSKINGGLSSARNMGIEHSCGEYICFVDSDDWIDEDYVEYLMCLCYKYNADVSSVGIDITSTYRINNEKEKAHPKYILKGLDVVSHYYKHTLNDSNLFSVCTCIFKRSCIGDIRFRVGKVNEDMDFKLKVLLNTNSWVISENKKYHYFQTGSSLSSGKVKKVDLDLLESSNLLWEMSATFNNIDITRYAYLATKKPYFSLLIRTAAYGCVSEINADKLINECQYELRANYPKFIFSPIKTSRKILITAFVVNYNITKFIINTIQKILH